MQLCTSLTARIRRMFRVITIVTTSLTLSGTSFLRMLRRSMRGSTNGFTAWKTSLLMCVKLVRRVLTSSSPNHTWPRRSITGGIDDEPELFGVRDDDRGGGAYVKRCAHRLRWSRSSEYRLQPRQGHGRARYGADL